MRGPTGRAAGEPMRSTLGATMIVAAALPAVLGGCSSMSNSLGDPFVQPGKYQYLRCEDIRKRLVTSESKAAELRGLMARADSSVVNTIIYQPELQEAEADVRQLRQTAGEKRCSDDVINAHPRPELSPLR